jgi:hypothetical protein
VYELSDNFYELGNLHDYKKNAEDYVKGPYNKLFPYIFKRFSDEENTDDKE